jgi:hypothetical protein
MPKLYSGHVRCFVMNSYLKAVLKEVQVLVSHVNDVAHVTENMEQRGRHGLTRIFSTRSPQPPPVSTSIAVPGACSFVACVRRPSHSPPITSSSNHLFLLPLATAGASEMELRLRLHAHLPSTTPKPLPPPPLAVLPRLRTGRNFLQLNCRFRSCCTNSSGAVWIPRERAACSVHSCCVRPPSVCR